MSNPKFVPQYFKQLNKGCENENCLNVYCSSNSSFKFDRNYVGNANQAAAEAIKLSHDYGQIYLDEFVNSKMFFTETILEEILRRCRRNADWTLLKEFIENIFSNRQNLSSSFLQKGFPMNISVQIDATSTKSVTSKSQFLTDPRVTIDNDEMTLDFDQMKRSMKLLTNYEDEILPTLISALGILFKQIQNELTNLKNHSLETDAHFLNIFFVIFELPLLSDPGVIFEISRTFYSLIKLLSLDIQAKLVRLFAKHKSELKNYVGHVQQYITMHTHRWSERSQIPLLNEFLLSSEKGMHEGLEVLRILFYANLLASERDAIETIDIERNNAQRMNIELNKRRQQRLDDDDDDDDDDDQQTTRRERNEPTSMDVDSSGSSGATAATATSPRTTTLRSSTHDDDEMTSIYQNPLKIRLALEPNEYRRGHLPFDDFINDFANEHIEISKEYLSFAGQRGMGQQFSFVSYPFFLSTINKISLLNIENKVQMYRLRHTSFFNSLVRGIRMDPVFKICLRRSHLIEDALIALEYQGMEHPGELKKQLFVEFVNEQGHDEGGLSKEFFQLITEQIFSPEYGMFMPNEEARWLWFNPSAGEDLDQEYKLIGMLLGLAIYNSIILDVKFPPVIYRKLMGKLGSFEDLEISHPSIYRSLKQLLAFDEEKENSTIEDAFCLTFQVGVTDATGSRLTLDLKENGDSIPVTRENRQEFVRLYSDLLLNKSIEKQFHPFYHGFLLVTGDSSLRKLFRPDEIDLLVAGSQLLDFSQLASAAEYDGGYSKDSPTIQNFWDVLMSFTDEQKRKFLRFTTGSDRAPIGGLARMKLIISRNGPDTDRLPTAHTCFNAFLLPDYSSKDKLREKLLIAINNAEGFGLL